MATIKDLGEVRRHLAAGWELYGREFKPTSRARGSVVFELRREHEARRVTPALVRRMLLSGELVSFAPNGVRVWVLRWRDAKAGESTGDSQSGT